MVKGKEKKKIKKKETWRKEPPPPLLLMLTLIFLEVGGSGEDMIVLDYEYIYFETPKNIKA